jgi:hypothetical protein
MRLSPLASLPDALSPAPQPGFLFETGGVRGPLFAERLLQPPQVAGDSSEARLDQLQKSLNRVLDSSV